MVKGAAYLFVGAGLLIGTACNAVAPVAGTPGRSASIAATAQIPPAPTITSGRAEVALVAAPRRRLVETLTAVQRGDVTAAREAFDAYDGEWNGIEVYVNFRSRALYGDIESHYQADINTALQAPHPDLPAIVPQLQAMIARYDEAIKLSDSGPPISPLFDDLAAIRTVRAPLRRVSPALKTGDTARATSNFSAFKARWPEVQALFASRSTDAQRDTQAALETADALIASTPLKAPEAAAAVDALMDRYNLGVNLLNAAARNADLNKTAWTADDVQATAHVGAIEREVRSGIEALAIGHRLAAAESAANAAGPRFEAVATVLQVRGGADVPLKKALDAYAAGLTQGSDVTTAGRAALDATQVAEQVLAGQFWTAPGFQPEYQAALATL